MRNQQNVKVKVNSSFETICPFPVGYVYMSSNSTSPADIYGGTWSAISGGRYMRAAGAWGNGGSNTITINQMPSHSHTIPKHYVYDKTGWSAPINNLSLPQVARPTPSSTPFATIAGLDNVTNTGGGQHSTQPTKMFGHGTELPKEGDASCVTFNKFKSALRAASRKFAHSPLVTFICQPTVQVQQALMEARGRLSQIAGSCDQAVRGTVKVANQRILSLRQKCHHTGTLLFPTLILSFLRQLEWLLVALALQLQQTGEMVPELLIQVVGKHITTFLHIAPVTLGIAQLSLVGEC